MHMPVIISIPLDSSLSAVCTFHCHYCAQVDKRIGRFTLCPSMLDHHVLLPRLGCFWVAALCIYILNYYIHSRKKMPGILWGGPLNELPRSPRGCETRPMNTPPMVSWYSMMQFSTAVNLLVSLKLFLGRFDMRVLHNKLRFAEVWVGDGGRESGASECAGFVHTTHGSARERRVTLGDPCPLCFKFEHQCWRAPFGLHGLGMTESEACQCLPTGRSFRNPFGLLLKTALKDRPQDHQPPTTNRHQPPPTANRHQPPPTANHHQPPTANRQPLPTATTADRHQPPIINHQPPPTATNRHQPPTATNHG